MSDLTFARVLSRVFAELNILPVLVDVGAKSTIINEAVIAEGKDEEHSTYRASIGPSATRREPICVYTPH